MIIKNKTVRLIKINEIKLLPGMNEISEAAFKANKKGFEYHTEKRHVEVPKLDIEDDLEEGISQYNSNDAISLVEETHDEDTLKNYLEEEKKGKDRKGVKAALEAKIKEAQDALKNDEDEDEGDLG